MSRPTVVFAGGGTGGHIYPAVAVHEQLAELSPAGLESLFLCSPRPLDAEILAKEQAPFVATPAQPFGLRPGSLWRFVRSWGPSVRLVRGLLREIKANTDRVVMLTTGGFVAAPAVQAAKVERIPVVMVNLDGVPGRANRWIAGRASRVVTSASVEHGPGKSWERVPPIVRRAALSPGSPGECRRRLGLDESRRTLLITGASQGARSLNQLMIAIAGDAGSPLREGWQVLHQTGDADTDAVRAAYAGAGIPAVVQKFVDGMGVWWGAADLALARCGAGIVAEAWANRVPAVFLPYPYHRDQHQRANAQPLHDAGAAVTETDAIEPAANLRTVGPLLSGLLSQDSRREAMRGAYARLGPADGARRVAQMVLEIGALRA